MQDRFKFRLYDDIHREMIDLQEQDVNPYNISDIPQNNIMQCTGLKDKNGKLIYEGDIVKLTNINDNEFVEIRQVIFKDCAFQFTLPNSTQIDRPLYCWAINYLNRYKHINLEILGNIYENTELLEVHHD